MLSPSAGQAALALASAGRFSVLGRAPLEALAEPATGGNVVLASRQPADGLSAADTYVAGLTATFVALAVPQGSWEACWKAAQRSPAWSRSAPLTAFRRPPSLLSSPQSSPSPFMTAGSVLRRRQPGAAGRLRSKWHRQQGAVAVWLHDRLSWSHFTAPQVTGLMARLWASARTLCPARLDRAAGRGQQPRARGVSHDD